MDPSNQHEVQFVSLFTACAIVYHRVMDEQVPVGDIQRFNEIVHGVARQLADLVPIYTLEPLLGKYRAIGTPELAAGEFARGASVFRAPRAVYTSLAIRRRDMQGALRYFHRAGTRFAR